MSEDDAQNKLDVIREGSWERAKAWTRKHWNREGRSVLRGYARGGARGAAEAASRIGTGQTIDATADDADELARAALCFFAMFDLCGVSLWADLGAKRPLGECAHEMACRIRQASRRAIDAAEKVIDVEPSWSPVILSMRGYESELADAIIGTRPEDWDHDRLNSIRNACRGIQRHVATVVEAVAPGSIDKMNSSGLRIPKP